MNKAIHTRALRNRTRYTDANARMLREAMGPGYGSGVTEAVIQRATRR